MTAIPPTQSRSEEDLFTARMHEVLADFVRCAAARWPDALRELLDQDPDDEVGESADPSLRLYEACCTLRLPAGHSALDDYATTAADLRPDERQALCGFHAPLPGLVYEVRALRGLCLRVNDGARQRLIDVRTPPKPFPLQAFIRPGALLLCRLVPLRDYYTHIGPLQVIRAEDRAQLAGSLQRQLAEQQRSGEEPVLRSLGPVSGPRRGTRN